MFIDLLKLNNFGYVDIDTDVIIPSDLYKNTDIRDIKDVHIEGRLSISYEDEVEANINIKGTFILPCAISLEDVFYNFDTNIEENIGKFEDFYEINKNRLDILPFIWENIVSEVPIRVVKDGIDYHDLKGNGWELISEE